MDKEFKSYVIPKPWGFEYLFFENDSLGIWFLHINHNEYTSLHCHPKKKTGLIVLDGVAEISFLNNKNILHPNTKTMLWPGVFHSTLSISNDGIDVLEVETPKDKLDLVRIKDKYGRENTQYENENVWITRDVSHIWLENNVNSTIKYKNYDISIKYISESLLDESKKTDIFVILENHAVFTQHDIPVCKVGDVLICDTLKYLSTQFQINTNSKILHISNETS